MRKLMIDPGHGGKDPGAVSDDFPNIFEKDIVLNISLLLRRYLLQTFADIYPLMTRNSDEFKSLGERAREANFQNAEIFVAIHTDAREINLPEIVGFEFGAFWWKDSDKMLADVIYEYAVQNLSAKGREVRRENFQVLRDTKCSATLLEVGFITDKDDVSIITDINNQRKIAKIIGEGINEFMHLDRIKAKI